MTLGILLACSSTPSGPPVCFVGERGYRLGESEPGAPCRVCEPSGRFRAVHSEACSETLVLPADESGRAYLLGADADGDGIGDLLGVPRDGVAVVYSLGRRTVFATLSAAAVEGVEGLGATERMVLDGDGLGDVVLGRLYIRERSTRRPEGVGTKTTESQRRI